MGELLIKPYEISVWEDKLTQNGFVENKLAVIGSDTMQGPNRVYEPVFNKKANGEKTLSFSLKYKYFDPYSGNEDIVNPFAALLVNERKVKLHYDDKWYEFIIKDHTESSDGLTWTYTCTDAFVLELSKTGYNLTFDAELNNNQGTARELAKKVLEDTDWRLGDANVGQQLVAEPIYNAVLESTTGIEIINASGNTDAVPGAGSTIYLFYSYVKNKNGKYVQFIIKDENRQYTIDDKNVITDTNFRILTELTFKDDGFYLDDTCIISFGTVETKYQANRLAYGQLTTYDPVMQRTVDRFKMGDREIYRYTDYTYTTSNVITNYIVNGENFNSLEDGSLQGWNPYVDSTGPIQKLELVTKPELGTGKELADLTKLSQIEGFLKVQFNGPLTANYENAVYNKGIESNTAFIQSISSGDEFVFRWRAATGSVDNLTPTKNLRLMVAKYTQDEPTRWGYYYKHIDPNNIILQFEGEPQRLNNIIKEGSLRPTTDTETQQTKIEYVVNDVVQTPSTKYIYIDNTNNNSYTWNGETGAFEEVDETDETTYLPYYYLTGKATKAIPNSVLTDPTENIGIFVYYEEEDEEETSEIEPFFIQDIQLTRLIRDGDSQPILLGNIPTATSTATEYYYLKPADGAAAEDVEMYKSVEELQEEIDSQEEIEPLYNENSEKNLSISASQSNCFNILQTIAETFECWIDLVVEHDGRGAIEFDENGPLKFVYLKEYAGKDNYAGFKYGINLESIERTINSDEFVTKLIVTQSQSDYADEGFVSITNADSNPSGESYILNFDYYYSQGLLDREIVEAEKNQFIENVSNLNIEIKNAEKERRDLEASLTSLASKRNVFTELVETAKETKSQALADFEYLTGKSYEEYKAEHGSLEEDDQLTEEETVLDALGQLYTSSSVINNYSGALTNYEAEYWKVRKELRGSENYKVKIWVDEDYNKQRHVLIELNDYLPGFSFYFNDESANSYESTVSTKFFDITTNKTSITMTAPTGYTVETTTYEINDNKIAKFKITSNETVPGIEDKIDELIEEKNEFIKVFTNKYRRYIQEGTWNSTDYINSELYYLDALQVSNTSAQPTVSYTINVVEISQLEGFDGYLFDAGDKSYVEDTEFFGWADKNGILTPAREEVIVSEVEWHLDAPDQNVITVQNYKTRFEDFFQRVNAAVQTVQYNEATYAKISSLMDANGTINQDVLVQSLQQIAGKQYNLTSDGSVMIDGDRILVQNLQNTQNRVIIDSEGIRISSDGGVTWATAIDGRGINIGTVYTGKLNTDQIVIGSEQNPSFRWDKSGISAYRSYIDQQTQAETYDLQTYVRYDQYGLYGIKDNSTFKAQSLEDVKDKAHFAVTWDGFFIKNSYEGGGRVEITSDNDFRVLNDPLNQGNFQEKIKIGALEWGDGITSPTEQGATALPTLYGIRIKNNNGDEVMKTDDQGNITIEGTIKANAGEIGGMSVDNNRMTMKYIVFEPETGIYSTYPYLPTQTEASTVLKPFIISDTDGSATFNNVIVRGSIKTSVFEYEEIQAVGGAFLFRPSSSIRDAVVSGNDIIFTTEKIGLFKVGDYLKVSNFSSETVEDEVAPDELNGFGLTYVYPVGAVNGRQVTLTGAASMLSELSISREDLIGGSLIDMGRHATQIVNGITIDAPGNNNYGIGINSSDGYINLPPRAISLFETIIHPNGDPKISYKYRGILGTLPNLNENPLDVNTSIYQYMQGTQGIYTDNMYLGDLNQFIAFYTDGNGDKQLRIKANQIVYEIVEDGQPTGNYQDINQIATEGVPGPAGEDAILVIINSSAGDKFLNGDVSTTLTCIVRKGTTDITNQINSFVWTNKDESGTIAWTRTTSVPYISITGIDIDSKAIITCDVMI